MWHHLNTWYLQLFEIARTKTKLIAESAPPRARIEHYFRFARNQSKIDAKRGDHFLQADFHDRSLSRGHRTPLTRLGGARV